jgi:hypothetical protein
LKIGDVNQAQATGGQSNQGKKPLACRREWWLGTANPEFEPHILRAKFGEEIVPL